jgi:hypothetical protein
MVSSTIGALGQLQSLAIGGTVPVSVSVPSYGVHHPTHISQVEGLEMAGYTHVLHW